MVQFISLCCPLYNSLFSLLADPSLHSCSAGSARRTKSIRLFRHKIAVKDLDLTICRLASFLYVSWWIEFDVWTRTDIHAAPNVKFEKSTRFIILLVVFRFRYLFNASLIRLQISESNHQPLGLNFVSTDRLFGSCFVVFSFSRAPDRAMAA